MFAFHPLEIPPTSLFSSRVTGEWAHFQVTCDSGLGLRERLLLGRGCPLMASNHQKPKFTATGSTQ